MEYQLSVDRHDSTRGHGVSQRSLRLQSVAKAFLCLHDLFIRRNFQKLHRKSLIDDLLVQFEENRRSQRPRVVLSQELLHRLSRLNQIYGKSMVIDYRVTRRFRIWQTQHVYEHVRQVNALTVQSNQHYCLMKFQLIENVFFRRKLVIFEKLKYYLGTANNSRNNRHHQSQQSPQNQSDETRQTLRILAGELKLAEFLLNKRSESKAGNSSVRSRGSNRSSFFDHGHSLRDSLTVVEHHRIRQQLSHYLDLWQIRVFKQNHFEFKKENVMLRFSQVLYTRILHGYNFGLNSLKGHQQLPRNAVDPPKVDLVHGASQVKRRTLRKLFRIFNWHSSKLVSSVFYMLQRKLSQKGSLSDNTQQISHGLLILKSVKCLSKESPQQQIKTFWLNWKILSQQSANTKARRRTVLRVLDKILLEANRCAISKWRSVVLNHRMTTLKVEAQKAKAESAKALSSSLTVSNEEKLAQSSGSIHSKKDEEEDKQAEKGRIPAFNVLSSVVECQSHVMVQLEKSVNTKYRELKQLKGRLLVMRFLFKKREIHVKATFSAFKNWKEFVHGGWQSILDAQEIIRTLEQEKNVLNHELEVLLDEVNTRHEEETRGGRFCPNCDFQHENTITDPLGESPKASTLSNSTSNTTTTKRNKIRQVSEVNGVESYFKNKPAMMEADEDPSNTIGMEYLEFLEKRNEELTDIIKQISSLGSLEPVIEGSLRGNGVVGNGGISRFTPDAIADGSNRDSVGSIGGNATYGRERLTEGALNEQFYDSPINESRTEERLSSEKLKEVNEGRFSSDDEEM